MLRFSDLFYMEIRHIARKLSRLSGIGLRANVMMDVDSKVNGYLVWFLWYNGTHTHTWRRLGLDFELSLLH